MNVRNILHGAPVNIPAFAADGTENWETVKADGRLARHQISVTHSTKCPSVQAHLTFKWKERDLTFHVVNY